MTHFARSHAAPLRAVAGRRQARRLFGALGALLRQSSYIVPDRRAGSHPHQGRSLRVALLAKPLNPSLCDPRHIPAARTHLG